MVSDELGLAGWVGEVFRRLGFVEYYRIGLYQWRPGWLLAATMHLR
jgi:hypothetical protein